MYGQRPVKMDRLLIQDFGDQMGIGDVQDLFGVEVELEGMKIITEKAAVMKWWTQHNDGSLRQVKPGSQCKEYVFSKPLNMDDTKAALKALFDHLNSPGVEVFPSYRTSIHVHVNCLNENYRTIFNFITLSTIFDELFVSLNGETRIANNFCLRTRDAEGQLADIMESVKTYGNLGSINHHHRYSSVNLASLNKFGTIEFRSLECTTDYNRVLAWIELIQGLKTMARQYSNPREIIDKFSRRGPVGFMMAHLGAQYAKYMAVPGSIDMIHNGMRLAQDFAYCSEWKQPTEADLKREQEAKPKYAKKAKWADAEFPGGLQQYIEAGGGAPAQWGNHAPLMAGQPIPMPAPAIQPYNPDEDDIDDLPEPMFIEDDDDDF